MTELNFKIEEKEEVSFIIDAEYIGGGIKPSGTYQITDNGEYDITEYATANVEVEKGVFPSGTKNITANGIDNVREYESVNVQVPLPSGDTTITANGTHNVTDYEQAIVNVPQGVFPSGTLSITENGTKDVTNYANVNVNVSGGGSGGIDETLLWTRTSETGVGFNATLSENISNYEYIKVVYARTNTASYPRFTTLFSVEELLEAGVQSTSSPTPRFYITCPSYTTTATTKSGAAYKRGIQNTQTASYLGKQLYFTAATDINGTTSRTGYLFILAIYGVGKLSASQIQANALKLEQMQTMEVMGELEEM